ncbi:translation elongation factor 4 [bacterium]|nr:translation elongation factor 4 [bacterium]
MEDYQKYIRNFCIISHIDHGKSTLADRFLELTNTVKKEKMKEQYLDRMDLEREKGITIKLQPVRMVYNINRVSANQVNVERFILNLIDTPGHVDFSYEVSRSLKAVEGAILLVDATSGIQAQTLANLELALEQNLCIIPVINKIDLPNAMIEETEKEIRALFSSDFNLHVKEIIKISARYGTNIEKVLNEVVARIPFPKGNEELPLKALIFDSLYDSFKGVIAFVRVFEGKVRKGDKIKMLGTGAESEVLEIGIFNPDFCPKECLRAGEIGYITTKLKNISLVRVGDTITSFVFFGKDNIFDIKPLSGYREPKPMVFASFYPAKDTDFEKLKDALDRLKLNDASIIFQLESSPALGRGFKCGFLGMLHLEITAERLKREYGIDLAITSPNVEYEIETKDGKIFKINSPDELPHLKKIKEIREPWAEMEIISPLRYMGKVMESASFFRAAYKECRYLSQNRVVLIYEIPLIELISGFYDKLKSVSSGYASLNYKLKEFRKSDLVCLDIFICGEKIPALSKIVPKEKAYYQARSIVKKLKEIIPPCLFSIPIQAGIENKIIARETIPALKKDVISHLYGGDYTRKLKLLQKQRKGKKRLQKTGKIKISPEVFLKVLIQK